MRTYGVVAHRLLLSWLHSTACEQKMADLSRITAPELEPFIVATVELTGNVLGAGAYGSVEEAKIPGAKVAAKKLHTELINLGTPQQVEKWVADFVEECKLMTQLRHPHIVQFLGVCYLPHSRLPVLLMEKLQTSLDSLLETTPNIPIDVKVHLLTGTGQGLVYLHSRNPPIAHRDLTARNVLVDNGLNAKITDMGVAKMVSIQPGQLAATMSQGPGNGLFMPPEALLNQASTRYNISIDIFSFGVVSLFTLTQMYPNNILPPNFMDPDTGRLVARTEIERRVEYIQPMKGSLGETHTLVQLTLQCLDYNPQLRPSAEVVLERLEEVGRSVPQSCSLTKLELIRQQTTTQAQELQHGDIEKQREIRQKDVQINQLQEQVLGLEELTVLQQQQLEVQREEIEQLSGCLQSVQLQPQPDVPVAGPKKSQTSGQRLTETNPPQQIPRNIQSSSNQLKQLKKQSAISWRRCANLPVGSMKSQVAVVGDKAYIGGGSIISDTASVVFEYDPQKDNWSWLTPHTVRYFGLCCFQGYLTTVGGLNMVNSGGLCGKVFCFDPFNHSWFEYIKPMPTGRMFTKVGASESSLVACGGDTGDPYNIYTLEHLSTVEVYSRNTAEWYVAEPTPFCYNSPLSATVNGRIFLLGGSIDGKPQDPVYADIDALVDQAISSDAVSNESSKSIWKTLPTLPVMGPTPLSLRGSLLVMGGTNGRTLQKAVAMFVPDTHVWTRLSAANLVTGHAIGAAAELQSGEVLLVDGITQDGQFSEICYLGTVSM